MAPAETIWPRVVFHADMDPFYAAIEQLVELCLVHIDHARVAMAKAGDFLYLQSNVI
jgi:nucleotidyltransferase/DNA polymerase involved in DNA repair